MFSYVILLVCVGCSGEPTGIQSTAGLARVMPTVDTLFVGGGLQLLAVDERGNPLQGNTLEWESGSPDVAAVDDNGHVAAIAPGRTSIAAVTPTGKSARSTIVVLATADRYASGATQAAFPGAEGYGAAALSTCDRSRLQVFRVSTLADDGPGSLRNAIANVPGGVLSVIVFDVAGYIDLESRIEITGNCLYIAGQTAPGDGIAIRPKGTTAFLLKRDVHDIVIRYLSVHGGTVNINVASGHDIILDHVTTGWATDKALVITTYDWDWSYPVYNVTLSRSLLHEMLALHPTALQISAEDRHDPQIDRVDVLRNLFASNSHRNPNVISNGVRVMNNVVYNWLQGAGHGSQRSVVDWVNNYFEPGPMTDARYTYEVTYSCDSASPGFPSYYVNGNVGPHNSDPTATTESQWVGDQRVTACYHTTGSVPGEPFPDSLGDFRREQVLPESAIPVTLISAKDAFSDVTSDVGAKSRLYCGGGLIERPDPIGRRVVAEATQGTGISRPPQSVTDLGGYPALQAGTACVDSDHDGMPDEFELTYGLDPNDPDDAGVDHNQNGYSSLEDYLNGIRPR